LNKGGVEFIWASNNSLASLTPELVIPKQNK
jgi:hypothetical protein